MGAHSLPSILRDSGLLETEVQKKIDQCETAVKYHMYHSLAILGLGLCPATQSKRSFRMACILFFLGICLFSGGLYSMVYLNRMGHWSIVPLGGATLMIAWLTLGIGAVFPGNSILSTGKLAR